MNLREIPSLCVGLIMGFYWARVLHLVRKTRKRTGNDAHFVPPEALGRTLRTLWYPTVALWIIQPLVYAFRPEVPAWNRALFSSMVVSWSALVVAVAAMVATLVCWKKMGKSWRMGIDPSETTTLVVTGPYAYVRHPIYALSSILMLASFAIVPTPLMFVLMFIHIWFLHWEARREERHQTRVHPTQYPAYVGRTGRFFPKMIRRSSRVSP